MFVRYQNLLRLWDFLRLINLVVMISVVLVDANYSWKDGTGYAKLNLVIGC